ncbi:MAG: Chromate resistance protein ChrB [Methanocella sp.]
MGNHEWLLLLARLPSTPSSLRVTVWRRMRAAGAVMLHSGAWVLPLSPKNQQVMDDCLSYVKSQDGKGAIISGKSQGEESDEDIVKRFIAATDEEYAEFDERCLSLMEEIRRESGQEKFTFAELDENEEDLQKLTSWLRKIRARDFFGSSRSANAIEALERCRNELQTFEKAVYRKEGLDAADDSS